MKHLSQSLEDYLEAIYVILQKKKVTRVKDIESKLNVKSASVIGALKKLKEQELVEQEPYGYIELTPEGKKIAAEVYGRHQTIFRFLTEVLNVDEKIAEKDACSMEHFINNQTYQNLIKFLNFIETCPQGNPFWIDSFKAFIKTGKRPDILHCIGNK